MPKISIIMPVYNKRSYLERSLDSVLNQDFSDYELIAIDDGSTDESLEILKKYASKDKRVNVIHTENQGVSHARNIGLDNANGEYITFVDADDEIKQNYLSSLYEKMQEIDTDVVIQGIIKVFPDGHKINTDSGLKNGIYQISGLLPEFATIQKQTGIFGYCVAKLFSSEMVKSIRFDEELNLAEDFDFYLKLYQKMNTIYMDNETNYLYYQDLPGSSVDVRDENIDYRGQFIVNCRYREFLKNYDSYDENNKKIVDDLIKNSAYHMLFYSDKKDFRDCCKLFKDSMDDFSQAQIKNLFERSVFHSVSNENYQKAQNLIRAYKAIRAIKRKVLL